MDVDIYRYDESWEVEALDTLEDLYSIDLAVNPPRASTQSSSSLQPNNLIIDLRDASDFDKRSLLHSINKPLSSLSPTTGSPFFQSSVMRAQWLELENLFGRAASEFKEQKVTLLCYNGDTSRVATSVLRAKGIEACSLKGGMSGLKFLRSVMSPQETMLEEDSEKGESDDGTTDFK